MTDIPRSASIDDDAAPIGDSRSTLVVPKWASPEWAQAIVDQMNRFDESHGTTSNVVEVAFRDRRPMGSPVVEVAKARKTKQAAKTEVKIDDGGMFGQAQCDGQLHLVNEAS